MNKQGGNPIKPLNTIFFFISKYINLLMKVPGQLSSTISFERINLLLAQFVKGKINTPIIEGWNTIESLLKEKKVCRFSS